MSFGFSVGDFLAVIQLANQIRQRFVDAPNQFKAVSNDVRNLVIVLQDVEVVVPHQEEQKTELAGIVEGCRNILKEIEEILDRYQELDSSGKSFGGKTRRVWKRFQWDEKEIDHFRSRITLNITAFSTFLVKLTSNVSFETKAGVDRLEERQVDQQRQTILDWLTAVDYAPQQSDYIRKRQGGTGQWLLDSAEYQTWLKTEKQTLFCPGIPGAGKTMLASIVIDDLNVRFHDPGIIVIYLYCNFRRHDEQKAEDLLASLLKQLSQGQSNLPDSVKALYDHHRDKRTRPSFGDISRVFQSVATIYSRVFIVVDALDECQVYDGCRTSFLSEIFKLQAENRINLFATSRFIPEITKMFSGCANLEIRASKEDVQKYLEGHMSRLPGFVVCSPELQGEIVIEIIRAVDGMFLLAQLHLESLIGKRSPKSIRIALKGLPSGQKAYDHAYNDAMERIEKQVSDAEELAKQVLLWIACAKRPLTASELQHALAVETGMSYLDKQNLPDINDMVSVCAGLVTVEEASNSISLVHYTTQEYFERTWNSWFPDAQSQVTEVCITYLTFDAFGMGPCESHEEFKDRLRLNVLYSYAAQNWGHHARAALMETDEVILDFLESGAKATSSSQVIMDRGYVWEKSPRLAGLHLAAYFGMGGTIIALNRNGHSIDVEDANKRTPLSYAAQNGHYEAVQLLLEKSARVNSRSTSGRTSLSYAAVRGHKAVVELLLEKSAEVDLKERGGWTSLTWAAEAGHEAIVEMLLEKSTNVDPLALGNDIQDEDRTPLSFAAERGHAAVVRLLLQKNAKVDSEADTEGDCGRTSLSFAAENGHDAVIKVLLEYNANVDSKDQTRYQRGRTPLYFAAGEGHQAAVKLLLENNALVDSKEATSRNPGRTPLQYAAEHGHESVVRLLLEHNAQIDSRSGHDRYGRGGFSDGWTALSYAADRGREAIVRLLLEKGAKVDPKDSKGQTPLSLAREGGFETVVELLLKNGHPEIAGDNLGSS